MPVKSKCYFLRNEPMWSHKVTRNESTRQYLFQTRNVDIYYLKKGLLLVYKVFMIPTLSDSIFFL